MTSLIGAGRPCPNLAQAREGGACAWQSPCAALVRPQGTAQTGLLAMWSTLRATLWPINPDRAPCAREPMTMMPAPNSSAAAMSPRDVIALEDAQLGASCPSGLLNLIESVLKQSSPFVLRLCWQARRIGHIGRCAQPHIFQVHGDDEQLTSRELRQLGRHRDGALGLLRSVHCQYLLEYVDHLQAARWNCSLPVSPQYDAVSRLGPSSRRGSRGGC